MAEYRRSAHAVFDLKYHLVWITKYRYKVLRGRVAERTRDLIRQSCEARELVIIRGAVSPDHIHMLVSAPAHLAPSKMVQFIKGGLVEKVAGGISGGAQEVLGAAHVGARLFLRDGGRGGRSNDQSVYRKPEVGRRRSGVQDHSAHRAFSRLLAGAALRRLQPHPRLSVAPDSTGFSR